MSPATCMRCPYSRPRPAREKRYFTVGEIPDGVYLLQLCDEHARQYDREMYVWEQLADFAEMKKSSAGQVTRPSFTGEYGDVAAERIRALREKVKAERSDARQNDDVLVGPRSDAWWLSKVAQERMKICEFTLEKVLQTLSCPEEKTPNPRQDGTFYFFSGGCCVLADSRPQRKRIINTYTMWEYMCAREANPGKGIA